MLEMVPVSAWRIITFVVLAVALAGTLVLSRKTGQLSELREWFKDIAAWIGSIPSAIRDNFAKAILPAILAILVVAAIAGFIFRKWLASKFPILARLKISGNLSHLPSALKDFVLVYRLYILIGVLTLLVVIGILIALEKRNKQVPDAAVEKLQKLASANHANKNHSNNKAKRK